MNRYILIASVFFLLCNFSYSQNKESLVHDNYKRTWITHLPKNYTKTKSYPLVIALHGGGGTAKQLMTNTRKRFNKLANKENFIVVYPQGIKKSWNDNSTRDTNGYARKENIDDVGFIEKMIAQIESHYNIKSNAIFACGISNGGLMSQTLAFELPEKIKAIGMVASNFGEDEINEIKSISPFSILFIHGTEDPIFPYEEGEINVFKKTRGKVLGIDKSIAFMVNLNGNYSKPNVYKIENTIVNDDCKSEHLKFPNPKHPSLKIELIKIKNGGHTWPGAKEQRIIKRLVGKTTQDFYACDKLWAFFKSSLN